MRIIEHGEKYEIGTVKCDKCGCLYGFTQSDIQNYTEVEESQTPELESNEPVILDQYEVVYCPECGAMRKIYG